QMHEIRIHEPGAPIDRQGWGIVSSGFHVYGTDTAARIEAPHFFHRCFAQPDAAKRGPNEEIVHDGTQAAIRHAVAKRDYYVSDVLGSGLNEPDMPQPLVPQQRREGLGCAPAIQHVRRLRIKLSHHCDELLNIVWRGSSHDVKHRTIPCLLTKRNE